VPSRNSKRWKAVNNEVTNNEDKSTFGGHDPDRDHNDSKASGLIYTSRLASAPWLDHHASQRDADQLERSSSCPLTFAACLAFLAAQGA
jgi:hypothetical protein